MNWPNLFIVGAAKAGTTTLHNLLGEHPAIHMSPVKEPHFFTRNIVARPGELAIDPIRDTDSYLKLFDTEKEAQYRGESSPSYIWEPGAPGRIHERCPDAKIIIALRDPIERAFSHYRMDFQAEREGQFSFLSAIENDQGREKKGWGISRLYLELGFYAEGVQRFIELFGKDNVKILFYETFFNNTSEAIGQLFDFLGVEGMALPQLQTHNPSMSGNLVNKVLKYVPFKRLIPLEIRTQVQSKLGALYRPKPSRKAVRFLLKTYQKDLRALHDMGIDFYTDYFATKYSYDVVDHGNGS